MKKIMTAALIISMAVLMMVGCKKADSNDSSAASQGDQESSQESSQAVSYTHLDVYKRQPIPSAMMKGTVIGPVVTPPESKATGIKSLGTKIDRMKTCLLYTSQQSIWSYLETEMESWYGQEK